MLLVTLYTQLRLTTSKAVNKLESKTCQVAEHNNCCKEGKIIIFLCRIEVLSCETHRYFVVALELKERKKKFVNHPNKFKANQNYHGWFIS